MFGRQKNLRTEEHLGSILNTLSDELLIVRGKDCRILYANTAARARMDLSENGDWSCKKHYCPAFSYLCESCIGGEATESSATFDAEAVDGRTYQAHADAVTWLDGADAVALRLSDTTQALEIQTRLYKLAYEDHLTAVPNRQKLKEDFDALAQGSAAEQQEGVLALFDLDNFKAVNDTYGHNAGDMMLCRLADFFKSDPRFSGHIYRLGGDEFVLLFSDKAGKLGAEDALRAHYSTLLESALSSYTIPNIDLSCTLSMGVALFPHHGMVGSDLLRKADIALYEAKEGGRNRMVFFEDRYDRAKKFKDLYVNIQPILMASGKAFGYELIDQGSDPEEGETVVLTEFNRTLDALGLGEVNQSTRYFIQYSTQLFSPAVLKNLPRDTFVIQMPYPNVLVDRETEKYRKLKKAGYKIALTGVRSPTAAAEVLAYADYCKFDPQDTNMTMQKRLAAKLPQISFIATGVDTAATLEKARETGFKLFQGFFFSQEATVRKTKEIDPLKVNYFRLLKLSSSGGHVDFKEISSIIASDVAMSYKLLRLLNSAAVGLRNVTSIQMAVTYLGEESLKKWIALLALRGVGEDKPLELIRMSLVRARFGELLCPAFRIKRDPNQVFLTGMLSLLHVAMEMSRDALLEEIPVAEDIRESLLTPTGPYSDLLAFFEHYEYANWDDVSRFCREHQLNSQLVSDCYIAAVKWYNDLSSNG